MKKRIAIKFNVYFSGPTVILFTEKKLYYPYLKSFTGKAHFTLRSWAM